MFETGRLEKITTETRKYKLHILGVSESRWAGAVKIETSTGETVYSGQEDTQNQKEVAIILKTSAEKIIIEWKPVSSRLIKINIRGKHVNMSILQC